MIPVPKAISNILIPFNWLTGQMMREKDSQYVPFDFDVGNAECLRNADGSIRRCGGDTKSVRDPKWKQNYAFTNTLVFSGFTDGHQLQLKDSDGNTFYMFHAEFESAIMRERLIGKTITGTFTFRKRGVRYGIELL